MAITNRKQFVCFLWLIELSGDASGDLEVIIGFGLNVNMQQTHSNIEQAWTSLAKISNQACDRQTVLVAVIKKLQHYLTRFEEKGFSDFADEWLEVDESMNQKVRLIQATGEIQGIA